MATPTRRRVEAASISAAAITATPAGRSGLALSAVAQVVAKVAHLALNLVSSLAVIHYLPPSRYGDFVVVVTVSALTGLVGDFGLARLAVRNIARDGEVERELVGAVVGGRLLLATLAIGLNQLIVILMGSGSDVRWAALVVSVMFWCEALLSVVVVFHVRLQQHYEAAIRVAMEATETACVLVLIHWRVGLPALMVPPVATAAAGAIFAIWLVRRRLGWLPRINVGGLRALLREAAPVAIALGLAAVYLRIGSLLVAALARADQVGFYGAAYQPIEYLLLASAVVINVLLPLLSSAMARVDRFTSLYRRGMELLVAGTIPITLVLIWTAPSLTRAAYGDDFVGAAAPLRVLAVALPALVLSFWQATVLLAGGHQRVTMAYDLGSVVSVVVLSVLLIPAFGPTGAALAVLVTSVGVLIVSTSATARRLSSTPDFGRLARILVAAAVMLVGLACSVIVPLAVAVAIGFVAYLATLVVVGVVGAQALAPLIDARLDVGVTA